MADGMKAEVAEVPPKASEMPPAVATGLDLEERGRPRNGEPQRMDRRLFVQLLVFNGCRDLGAVRDLVSRRSLPMVLYEDVNDPTGFGLLSFSEDPGFFLDTVRPLLLTDAFAGFHLQDEYTMLGRTYSMGWEADLEEALITRPKSRLCSPDLAWAIWYPLRRSGAFEELALPDQHAVLSEHASVGQQFGNAGVAHDIRLACHGLSRDDNDFILGILGARLFPLSAVVQRMRKTRQTSRYLARLGPFFIGRALWQAPAG